MPDSTPEQPKVSKTAKKEAKADYEGDLGSCKEIKARYKGANKAYFLTVNGRKFKTFCDMDDGGLTLVWSYSEETDLSTYEPVGEMCQRDLQTYKDAAQSFDDSQAGAIVYDNFRLPLDIMRSLISEEFKIAVTTDPKDPNNDLSKENYIIFKGSEHIKLLFSKKAVTFNTGGSDREISFKLCTLPANGKLLGNEFHINGNFEGTNMGDFKKWFKNDTIATMKGKPLKIFLIQNEDECLHLTINEARDKRLLGGLEVGQEEAFFGGFYGSCKTNLFGKCKSSVENAQADCGQMGGLIPHSKLRYIQWWIK